MQEFYVNIDPLKQFFVNKVNQRIEGKCKVDSNDKEEFTFTFLNKCGLEVNLNSNSYYLAISLERAKQDSILIFTDSFTDNEGKITFEVDSNTANYVQAIIVDKECWIEIGSKQMEEDTYQILLQDKCICKPRVYSSGISPVVDLPSYYTKDECDSIFMKKEDIPSISGYATKEYVDNGLSNKVDKVEGKQLSTNDFTNEEKLKLADLHNYNDTDLYNNIYDLQQTKLDTATFNSVSGTFAKTTDIPTKNSQLINDSGFITINDIPSGDTSYPSTTEPVALYVNSQTTLGLTPPDNYVYNEVSTSISSPSAAIEWTWIMSDNYKISPTDNIVYGLNDGTYGPIDNNVSALLIGELYVDDKLVRSGFTHRTIEFSGQRFIMLDQIYHNKIIDNTDGKTLKLRLIMATVDSSVTYTLPIDMMMTDTIKTQIDGFCGLLKNYPVTDIANTFGGIYSVSNYSFSKNIVNYIPFYASYYNSDLSLTLDARNYARCTQPMTSLQLTAYGNDWCILFTTDSTTEMSFSISIPTGYQINKPFVFEKGKSYIIACDNYTVFWSEVQAYTA